MRRKNKGQKLCLHGGTAHLGHLRLKRQQKMSQLKENLRGVGGWPRTRRGKPEAPCSFPVPREVRPRPAAGSTALTSPPPPCCAR